MPKPRTWMDDFVDVFHDRRDHDMLKKAGEKYDNYKNLPLEHHPWKDKPEILDQFTLEYRGKWDGYSNPFSIWNLYVYEDRIDIHRSRSSECYGPEYDAFRFEDIETITCNRRQIKFSFKEGKRYNTDEEKKKYIDRSRGCPPSEIWFDPKYDEYFKLHYERLQDIFSKSKRSLTSKNVDECENNASVVIDEVHVHGGNVNIGGGKIVDISSSSIAQNIFENVSDTNEREDMLQILKEIESSLNDIKAGLPVQENKGLMDRLKKHIKDNSWFYSDILNLAGTVFLKKMGLS